MALNPIMARLEEQMQQDLSIPSEDLSAKQSLDKVQETLAANTALVTESIASLRAGQEQSNASREVLKAAVTVSSKAMSTIKATQDNVQMAAENAISAGFSDLGAADKNTALLKEFETDQNLVNDLLDKRIDVDNDKFTRIPLIDGIINDFRSFQLDEEIKNAQAKEQHTAAQIAGNTAALESTARQQELTKRTVNEATMKANQDLILANAATDKAKIDLATVANNSVEVGKIMQMSATQLNSEIASFRAAGESISQETARLRADNTKKELEQRAKTLPLRLAQLETNLESAELALENAKDPKTIAAKEAQKDAIIKAQADAIAEENAIVEAIQAGEESIKGQGNASSPALIRSMLSSRDSTVVAQTTAYLNAGSSPKAAWGDTYGDSVAVLELTTGGTSGIAETKITKLIDKVEERLETEYVNQSVRNPNVRPKKNNTTQIAADRNTAAQLVAAESAKNIITGDGTNPYQAPSFDILVQQKAVASSLWFQKVGSTISMTETNPQTLVDITVEAVQAGTLKVEEAAEGLVTLFTAAAVYNNTQGGGYSRIGFPEQESYNTKLTRRTSAFENLLGTGAVLSTAALVPLRAVESLLGGPKSLDTVQLTANRVFADRISMIDMMNSAELTNNLMSRLAEQSIATKPIDNSANNTENSSGDATP